MFQKDIRVLAQKLKKAYSKIRLIESADISTKVAKIHAHFQND